MIRFYDRAELQQDRLRVFLFGPDEQLATKLPQVLPEEVEAFPHVRDLLRDRRLLGREDQTALTQQAFDDGTTRPHWRLTFGRRRYPQPR